MFAKTKSTKPQLGNGHFVKCIHTFVKRNMIFATKTHKTVCEGKNPLRKT